MPVLRILAIVTLVLGVVCIDTRASAVEKIPIAPTCSAVELRQLDWLVGIWDNPRTPQPWIMVRNEPVAGGCAILESRAGNDRGQAYTNVHYYSAEDKRWHLRSVRANGEVVELVGTIEGRELRYTDAVQKTVRHRVVYTNEEYNGKRAYRVSVKVSSDSGKTYDGDEYLYTLNHGLL